MSSFWDNNKDTFKAVGKSAAIGLGRGAKAVGNAGYKTYKNNEAKRKGLPPPEFNDDGTTRGSPPPMSSSAPLNKEQLNSMPPPPKRNVSTQAFVPGQVSYPLAQQPVPSAQPIQQQQPVQLVEQYQPPMQPPIQQPTQQYQAPGQSAYSQPIDQFQPPSNPPPSYERQVPPPPPARNSAGSTPQVSSPGTPVEPKKFNYGVRTESEEENTKPKTPLPDASKFAPPPVHRGRGSSSPQSTGSVKPQSSGTSVASPMSPPEKTRSPVPAIAPGIDVSKFAPPPKVYHGEKPQAQNPVVPPPRPVPSAPSQQVSTPQVTSSVPQRTSAAGMKSTPERVSVPAIAPGIDVTKFAPPPPRPGQNSAPPTNEQRTVPAPPQLPSRTSSNSVTGKKPPPKPVKKPGVAMPQEPPPYREDENRIETPDILDLSIGGDNKTPKVDPHLQALENALQSRGLKPTPATGINGQESKPVIAPKPKIAPKPVIGNKPVLTVDTDVGDDKTTKPVPKPAHKIASKPVTAPKPVIAPKPVVAPKPSIKEPEIPKLESKPVVAPKPVAPKPKPQVLKATPSPKAASPAPPPPPSRNYSKASVMETTTTPPNHNLELTTGWFANVSGPLVLPKDLQGLNYTSSYSMSSQFSNGTNTMFHTRNISVRCKDLSIVRYKISWKNDDINDAISNIEQFIPSPLYSITNQELINSSNQFGNHVASWCEHNMGRTVGRGECWDLAHDALAKGCGKHAFVSNYTIHGFPILQIEGVDGTIKPLGKQYDEIRRGDILQYETCTFYNEVTRVTSTAGAPDHTSVVLGKEGDKILIAEQNVNGVKKVVNGEVIVRNLKKGKLFCYRPMPAMWAGEL